MREMCHQCVNAEAKMVTGEQAIQFSCLVVLEMWKEVKREGM